MAIDAKVSFLREMEKQGAETIPQAMMQRMLQIASDVLEGFDMREVAAWENEGQDDLLERYLKRRKDKDDALFVGQGICDKVPKRLQPNGVRVLLKKIGKRAGVEHVHPHKFRRTKATELARHGMPIQTISHILGHEKIETSMEYVIQKPEDVKIEYRRYA